MARPINVVPTYREHKRTGKAVVTVRNPDGTRKEIHLPGAYGSPESKAEYERILALLRANAGRYPARSPAADLTVNELVLQFMQGKVAVDYIDADGKPTREHECFRRDLVPLCRLWGSSIAAELDAPRLETVQESMATGSWMTDPERERRAKRKQHIGWCRKSVNKAVCRIRALIRWGVRRKLIPASVLAEAQVVEPLRPGRGKAREAPPVIPVDPAVVDATLPHLPPVVRDMVKVQLATGMRPGELCGMRVRDLDNTGEPVWHYRPAKHKTQHHGHTRCIAIGPQAQIILRRYLKPNLEAFLFSPQEQDAIIKLAKREARKTPVQPSQANRSKPIPNKKPGERFEPHSYNRAIARACRKAVVEPWHAHQLRHTTALLIEREHGAEAARALLGHKTLNMTLHYSGIDAKRAAQVALASG